MRNNSPKAISRNNYSIGDVSQQRFIEFNLYGDQSSKLPLPFNFYRINFYLIYYGIYRNLFERHRQEMKYSGVCKNYSMELVT